MFGKIAVATALGLLFTPSLALAVTAEETFAFIIFNIQDGDKALTGSFGPADVAVTAQDPLTYEVKFASGEKTIFAIRQETPCVFNVAADLGEVGKADIKFDMNKFVGVSEKPMSDDFVFTNDCAIQVVQNSQCLGAAFKPGMMLNSKANPDRIKRAVAFFKKEFCSGSPF